MAAIERKLEEPGIELPASLQMPPGVVLLFPFVLINVPGIKLIE